MSTLLFSKVAPLLFFSLRVFLCALGALIAFRLLNGTISMRGMLKDRETGGISALRLQMLIATLIAGASYASAIHRQTAAQLPQVDATLLALVTGSNGLVLIKRAFSKLSRFLRPNIQV
jgi:hypothetical protein